MDSKRVIIEFKCMSILLLLVFINEGKQKQSAVLSRGSLPEFYETIDEFCTQAFSRHGASSGSDEMSAGPLMTSI